MINFCLLTDKSNAVLVAPPTSGPLKSSLEYEKFFISNSVISLLSPKLPIILLDSIHPNLRRH